MWCAYDAGVGRAPRALPDTCTRAGHERGRVELGLVAGARPALRLDAQQRVPVLVELPLGERHAVAEAAKPHRQNTSSLP